MVFNKTLFALREDQSAHRDGSPSRWKPSGNWDFGGTFKWPTFTAHPKRDPVTGQWIAFGYSARGMYSRDVVYYEISPDGRVTHEVEFEVPTTACCTTSASPSITRCFPIIPQCGVGEEALKAGERYYAWDSTKDIYLGVLPRGGRASDLRWFKAPNQFCSHVMNAFDDGTKVYIDVPRAESNMFPFFPERGKPWDPTKAAPRLHSLVRRYGLARRCVPIR